MPDMPGRTILIQWFRTKFLLLTIFWLMLKLGGRVDNRGFVFVIDDTFVILFVEIILVLLGLFAKIGIFGVFKLFGILLIFIEIRFVFTVRP